MVLVDTSVWVKHFRIGEPVLVELLSKAAVLIHPFIVGELACGNLKNRARVLADLGALTTSQSALDDEVFRLMEGRRLWGRGIGWVDAHLLASALLTGCEFWTLDKRLHQLAGSAGVMARKSG